MEPQFWHDCWQHNRLGWHQQKFHPLLQQYADVFAGATGILVPLCGKSLDMVLLAQHANVVGAELNAAACLQFFSEQQLSPAVSVAVSGHQRFQHGAYTLWQGDFFTLPAEAVANVSHVFDRAALIALPEPLQRRYVQTLQRLFAHTTLWLLSLEYPAGTVSGPPFAINETQLRNLFDFANVEQVAELWHRDGRFGQRQFNTDQLVERLYRIIW